MNKTLRILVGISLIPLAFGLFFKLSYTDDSLSGATGTINQLDQWKKSGIYITQNVASTSIKLTGLESSGDCLVTNASGVVTTSTCGSGGGSVSDWLQANGALTPTTTIGIRVNASSTISGLTVDGNSTTTGNLIVDGATRLATSLSGLLYANAGAVSATATGTLTTTATGLELSATRGLVGGASVLSLTSGYVVPTTTRANLWDGKQDTITAGDALTLTGTDIDFDGGATPSGDLGNTWASPSVTDDSHAHTGATLSGVDISSDTNLTADGTEIILTGDALSLGTALTFTTGTSSTSFQTPLLGIGSDYISDITGTGLTLTNGVLSATASGGSASDWKQLGGFLTPTTTIGINVPTASTMGTTTHSGSLLLASNDGGQLGALGTAWGDLFLASGGVINWNNSDVTITHAGNQLTFNGASSGYTFNNLISGTDLTLTGLLDAGGAALEIPNGTAPTVDSIGEIAIDSTSNQLVLYGSAKKVYGDGNFYPSFTYATSTAWTGTTTIPLGAPFTGETWNGAKCWTDVGTVNVDFGDGTNFMNATTSKAVNPVPTHTLSTNNTFTAGETRYARVGTPVSSPTKISCTISKTITSD